MAVGEALLQIDEETRAVEAAVATLEDEGGPAMLPPLLKSVEAIPVLVTTRPPKPPRSSTLFVHDIYRNGLGGTTIAYQYNDELDMYVVGVARCNTVDHYNRKIGRTIAMASLLEHPIFIPDEIRMYPEWPKMEAEFIVNYLRKALRGALL